MNYQVSRIEHVKNETNEMVDKIKFFSQKAYSEENTKNF
jgi:hypothetical protein